MARMGHLFRLKKFAVKSILSYTYCIVTFGDPMRNFIAGFALGIVVCTAGFAGLITIFDKGLAVVKEQVKEISQ